MNHSNFGSACDDATFATLAAIPMNSARVAFVASSHAELQQRKEAI